MSKQPSLLELRHISKSFGALNVASDVSFSVQKGERLALIGPNGAGKTTIFNLISGVYPVSDGQIFLDGVDVTHLPSHQRINYGIARNFQNIRLMKHLTVVENLILGQHVNETGIRNLLTPFGFSKQHRWWQQAYHILEQSNLTEYADYTVDALPYGLRKRVELARALLAQPKLLLLDEPAAGLNPTESKALMEDLINISDKGVTLLIVEHDMKFVHDLCERVIVLNFGEKIAEGTMDEIKQQEQVQIAYLGMST